MCGPSYPQYHTADARDHVTVDGVIEEPLVEAPAGSPQRRDKLTAGTLLLSKGLAAWPPVHGVPFHGQSIRMPEQKNVVVAVWRSR